jgi:hypothetical protein
MGGRLTWVLDTQTGTLTAYELLIEDVPDNNPPGCVPPACHKLRYTHIKDVDQGELPAFADRVPATP